MAAKTVAELQSLIASNFPDNTEKAITPEKAREVAANTVESVLNKVDGGTVSAAISYAEGVEVAGDNQLATKAYVDANSGGGAVNYNDLAFRSQSTTFTGGGAASYTADFEKEFVTLVTNVSAATTVNIDAVSNTGRGKAMKITLDSKHSSDALNVTLGSGVTIYPRGGPFVPGELNLIQITNWGSFYTVTIDPQV